MTQAVRVSALRFWSLLMEPAETEPRPADRSSAPVEADWGVLAVRVAVPWNVPLAAGAAPLSTAGAVPEPASSNR